MSSKFYIELNKDGVGELLKDQIMPMLMEKGQAVASRVDGAELEPHVGKHRAYVNIRSKKYKKNELLKALR